MQPQRRFYTPGNVANGRRLNNRHTKSELGAIATSQRVPEENVRDNGILKMVFLRLTLRLVAIAPSSDFV